MARAMTRLAGFSEAVGCTRPSIVLESRPLCVGTCGQRCMVPVIHLYPTKRRYKRARSVDYGCRRGRADADHTTRSAIRERAACCPARKTRADMCLGGGRRDFVTRGWWDSVSVGYRRPAVGGLFHAWDEQGSSLLNELMPDGFPIAPRWILPILTAGLTPTECRSASGSAETAPARLHSWTAPQRPAYAG